MRIEEPRIEGAPTYIYLESEAEHVVIVAQYNVIQLVAIPSEHGGEDAPWCGFHLATRPRYFDTKDALCQ